MSQALPLITRHGDRIAIISGLRTPFARQATAFHGYTGSRSGKNGSGGDAGSQRDPARGY